MVIFLEILNKLRNFHSIVSTTTRTHCILALLFPIITEAINSNSFPDAKFVFWFIWGKGGGGILLCILMCQYSHQQDVLNNATIVYSLTMILNDFRSSVEGFFASKGAAYAIPDGDFARKASLKGGRMHSGYRTYIYQLCIKSIM